MGFRGEVSVFLAYADIAYLSSCSSVVDYPCYGFCVVMRSLPWFLFHVFSGIVSCDIHVFCMYAPFPISVFRIGVHAYYFHGVWVIPLSVAKLPACICAPNAQVGFWCVC